MNIEYNACKWDWKKLGFESEHEMQLYRYFQNHGNTAYSGYELIENLYTNSAGTED